jgi:hypothetical protein
MKPNVGTPTATIVQPSPASTTFPSTYIANVSRSKITATCTFPTKAKLKSATLTYSGSAGVPLTLKSCTTDVYEATTTSPLTKNTTCTVTFEDERGMKTAKTVAVSGVLAYSFPSVTVNSYYRCDSDKTKNDAGAYCLMSVTYKLTPLNNQNIKKGKIESSAYTDERTLSSYTQTVEYLFAADIEHSYEITVTAIDAISQTSKTVALSTAGVIMDFLSGGKGVGLGKVAEHQQMVEVNPEWELKASVKIGGQLYDLATLLAQIKQQLGI